MQPHLYQMSFTRETYLKHGHLMEEMLFYNHHHLFTIEWNYLKHLFYNEFNCVELISVEFFLRRFLKDDYKYTAEFKLRIKEFLHDIESIHILGKGKQNG